MKRVLFIFVTALCPFISFAADEAATTNNPAREVRQLVRKVETKLQQGKDKESDFQAELKEFDQLIDHLKKSAPQAAAEAAFMKGVLYVQVFDDSKKGAELLEGVTRDFPKTSFGTNAAEIVSSIQKQEAAKAFNDSLKIGTKLPDFSEKDIAGKSFSLANYKGKVVLLDFWATWCGPCRAELPNVLDAYKQYHGRGFEIMGVSLDKEKSKLDEFTKSNNMSWQQYFDGEGWGNKLAQQFGISSIPATFLLDRNGVIIAKDLRGEQLSEAIAKALAKK